MINRFLIPLVQLFFGLLANLAKGLQRSLLFFDAFPFGLFFELFLSFFFEPLLFFFGDLWRWRFLVASLFLVLGVAAIAFFCLYFFPSLPAPTLLPLARTLPIGSPWLSTMLDSRKDKFSSGELIHNCDKHFRRPRKPLKKFFRKKHNKRSRSEGVRLFVKAWVSA